MTVVLCVWTRIRMRRSRLKPRPGTKPPPPPNPRPARGAAPKKAPCRQSGRATERPQAGPERSAPRTGAAPRSEPEARAHVVAALVHAHVVEVIAPLRVATLVL